MSSVSVGWKDSLGRNHVRLALVTHATEDLERTVVDHVAMVRSLFLP